MKINFKKIVTVTLVTIVALSMVASYTFTASGPVQPIPEQADETGFIGPVGDPYVNGPSGPPPAQ